MNADPKGMARQLTEAADTIARNTRAFSDEVDTIRLVAATLENVIEPAADLAGATEGQCICGAEIKGGGHFCDACHEFGRMYEELCKVSALLVEHFGESSASTVSEHLAEVVAKRATEGPGDAVTVPLLTGCCQDCGRAPKIAMSRVNETVCVSVVPHPECIHAAARFNLWPVAPNSVVDGPSDGEMLDWWFSHGMEDSVCEGSVDLWWATERDGDAVTVVTHGVSVRDALAKAMRGEFDE